MAELLKDLKRRVDLYTGWLEQCAAPYGLFVVSTDAYGPFPYQWKIGTRDSMEFVGHLALHGPAVNGTEQEIRQSLCSLLLVELAAHCG
jgi:hypothetical protein